MWSFFALFMWSFFAFFYLVFLCSFYVVFLCSFYLVFLCFFYLVFFCCFYLVFLCCFYVVFLCSFYLVFLCSFYVVFLCSFYLVFLCFFYLVFDSSYRCIDAIFNAGESSPAFFSRHCLSMLSLWCKALFIVISFIVLWSICQIPSLYPDCIFLLFVLESPILFHFWSTVWCRPCTLGGWSFLAIL